MKNRVIRLKEFFIHAKQVIFEHFENKIVVQLEETTEKV